MNIRCFLISGCKSLFILIVGMLTVSCLSDKTAATGVGNPGEVEGQFAMEASSGAVTAKRALRKSQVSLIIEDKSGLEIEITELKVNVRHIEFELPAAVNCSPNNIFCTETSVKIEGPFAFDMLSKTSEPELPEFFIPEGSYRRLDIRLDDVNAEDGILSPGHILEDNTMLVRGNFDYDGLANRRLTVLIKFNEDARFEAEEGILVSAEKPHPFLLQFDAAQWFSNLDIAACIEGEDPGFDSEGNLLLDDSVCGSLESSLKENIKNSGQLK